MDTADVKARSRELRLLMDQTDDLDERRRLRNQIYELNEPLARAGFTWVWKKLPPGLRIFDDVSNACHMTLLEAIDSWNPEKATLGTWFHIRLRKTHGELWVALDGPGVMTAYGLAQGHLTDGSVSLDWPISDDERDNTTLGDRILVEEDDAFWEGESARLIAEWLEETEAAIREWCADQQKVGRYAPDPDVWMAVLRARMEGRHEKDLAAELGISRQAVNYVWNLRVRPIAAGVWWRIVDPEQHAA